MAEIGSITPAQAARLQLREMGCWQVLPVEIRPGAVADCWRHPDGTAFIYTADGVIYIFDEETKMATMADLVARYNAKVPAEKRVKRFETKAIAEKRVAAVEGKPRGKKPADGLLAFKQSPEDKVWQAESLRAKMFKNFEGSTVDIQNVLRWAISDGVGMTMQQARGCINILIKDKWVTRV